jgi:hypothetical protein
VIPEVSFSPSADVAALLNLLLDKYERRYTGGTRGNCAASSAASGAPLRHAVPGASHPGEANPATSRARPITISLDEIDLPAYFSQLTPEPRLVTNQQLGALEQLNLLRLGWLPGEEGHLLREVSLPPEHAAPIYYLLGRVPVAERRASLESQLLGERFRFPAEDWRAGAIDHVLYQLNSGKSPGPFSLEDSAFNADLLVALVALDELDQETPYRLFSVRVFNDSKRFESLARAIVRLARLGCPAWRRLSPAEILGEIQLVANPSFLYLSGPWDLFCADGQVLSLSGFVPAVGFPAAQAAHLTRISVHAPAVLGIENPTSFYQMCEAGSGTAAGSNRAAPGALVCLMGNPSPAMRRLLWLTPEDLPILVWADLDYGGLNILSQLRGRIGPRVTPYRMDIETLETHAAFARPLTRSDRRNLEAISRRPTLRDMKPVIQHMLLRGLKLEQEGVEANK